MNLLGEMLKSTRRDKKIDSIQVADLLNCSRQNLSRIEAADNIKENTLLKYAQAIGCDIRVEIIDKDTQEILRSEIITQKK